MRQIKTLSIGKSSRQGRSRQQLSQRHLKKHQPSHQIIQIEPSERDAAALIALRPSIARSLMEIMPHFTLSGDGNRVCRIEIGGTES